jgi:DNA-binding SARP family transcriptional activator
VWPARGLGIVSQSAPATDRAQVFVLGGFRVTCVGRGIALSTPACRVIAYLAVHGAGPVPRQTVAEALWPDRDAESARVNLRQAIANERRSGGNLIVAGRTELSLRAPVEIDMHRALIAAHWLVTGPCDGIVDASHFLHDLLPDWDEEWLRVERERFNQLRLHSLEELCQRWLARGQPNSAIAVARAAVAADPLRESAQRLLIQAYLAEGNRAQALRQYRTYEEEMEIGLGLEPSQELRNLLGL